jgi:ABC-type sugar transport system permease subunit
LVFFALFSVYPIAKAFQISFYDWNLINPMEQVGFKNYIDVFEDGEFLHSFKVTLQYILMASPISWLLGFFLAVVMNTPFRMRNTLRAVYFIPSVFPVIGVAVAWWVMYQPTGLINNLLGTNIPWMTRGQYAMPGIAIMDIWRASGYYMVLFLVGLQSIPNEFYEAAMIDGANAWQLTRDITIPLMRPVIAFVAIIGMIWGIQVLIPMFVMTGGGPGKATKTLVMLIYHTGMEDWRMGLASAMSVIFFLIVLILTLIQIRYFRVGEIGEVV